MNDGASRTTGTGAQPAALPRAVRWTGAGLSGLIAALATTVFVLSVYQFDFWDTYFFRNTVDVGTDCRVAIQPTSALTPGAPATFVPLELNRTAIPHSRHAFRSDAKGKSRYVTAYYNCRVPTYAFTAELGLTNLHTGWIVGQRVELRVNSAVRAAFTGLGKPTVALTNDDLSRETIDLEIVAVADDPASLGLVGLTKMVVAQGASLNARVLGVDFALTNQKNLYTLLPLLTLGLVLVFGWVIGIRTRMMTVTFFYIAVSALRNVTFLLADFWPWGFESIFWGADVLLHGGILAFVLFGLEMLGLLTRWIMPLMAAVSAVILGFVIATLAVQPTPDTMVLGFQVADFVESACMIFVIVRGLRVARAETANAALRGTQRVVVALTGFVLFATWFDFTMIKLVQAQVRLLPQVEKLLPLVVGAILFHALYQIEQKLREERERRGKMETELTIAAKLQGVLVPKDLEGSAHGCRYEIVSQPHGILSGDWVKVFSGARGALFVLGDVVGKGPSAALTHSGLAASWGSQIKLWESGLISASELMVSINATMYDLYQGTMNTTYALAEVAGDGTVRVAAGGNYWLHLAPAKSTSITSPGRGLLGLKAEFTAELRTVQMAPGDWLVCFTDGVLEGNRNISRFLRGVQPEIPTLTGPRIRELLAQAGEGQVHPDDASSLVLHFPARPGVLPGVA